MNINSASLEFTDLQTHFDTQVSGEAAHISSTDHLLKTEFGTVLGLVPYGKQQFNLRSITYDRIGIFVPLSPKSHGDISMIRIQCVQGSCSNLPCINFNLH